MRTARRAAGWAECLTTVAVIYAAVLWAVPMAAAGDRFKLAEAIPSDVFVVEVGMHVPEQDFIQAHWNEVWAEWQKSGIGGDLMKLVKSAMDDEQRTEFDRVYNRFGQVCSKIDWDTLGSGEVAFAERMTAMQVKGTSVSIGMPDILLAFRPTSGDVAANYKGLVGLLETTVDEINTLGELDLKLEHTIAGDVQTTEFNMTQMLDEGPVLALSVSLYKDTILVTLGRDLRNDTLALMTGETEAKSIVETPRFKAAFAKLPEAHHGWVYFDMQNLKDQIQDLSDAIFTAIEEDLGDEQDEVEGVAGVKRVVNRVITSMGVMDCAASVYRTKGVATYTEGVTLLAADAKSNPIYPVISSHERVTDWQKYLPAETTDFTVSAGFSLPALYTYIKESFDEAGDPGKQAWAMWEGFLAQNDFDMQRDVFAWLDTASVSVNFEQDGTDAWALLLKVKDEEMAGAKLQQGLEMANAAISELATQIPPMAMMQMEIEPTSGMEGFHDLIFAIAPEPMVAGVRDGWIMIASSQDALETVLATAGGSHDNVSKNGFIMDRSLMPKGAVETISFADHRGDAETMGQVLSGISGMGGMVAAMIPEPEAREMIAPVFSMISRLGPVVAKMNFFEATAATYDYDGDVFRSRSVTHYVPAAQ